jgi:hypothetical protein
MGPPLSGSPEYPGFVPCPGYCEECVPSAKALMLGLVATAALAAKTTTTPVS